MNNPVKHPPGLVKVTEVSERRPGIPWVLYPARCISASMTSNVSFGVASTRNSCTFAPFFPIALCSLRRGLRAHPSVSSCYSEPTERARRLPLPLFTELPRARILGNPRSPGPIGPGPTGPYPRPIGPATSVVHRASESFRFSETRLPVFSFLGN